jgi:uncharacterized protein (DUF2062 family)
MKGSTLLPFPLVLRRAAALYTRVLKRVWIKCERWFLFHLIRLFRIRAASEKVARGFALGLAVNFYPTFGFGVLISGFVARVLGGNLAAGLAGGALLTFAWPFLFYLNVRMGSWMRGRRPPLQDPSEVTEKTIDALVWGKNFTVGAIVNSLLVALAAYLLLRLIYHEIRPGALAWFRRHAREHQRKFGRRRLRIKS